MAAAADDAAAAPTLLDGKVFDLDGVDAPESDDGAFVFHNVQSSLATILTIMAAEGGPMTNPTAPPAVIKIIFARVAVSDEEEQVQTS